MDNPQDAGAADIDTIQIEHKVNVAFRSLLNRMENKDGKFRLMIAKSGEGEWYIAYEFGEETPGNSIYGGASYGVGGTFVEALEPLIQDLRLEAS
jgi:hypothetical protein